MEDDAAFAAPLDLLHDAVAVLIAAASAIRISKATGVSGRKRSTSAEDFGAHGRFVDRLYALGV